MAKYVVAKVDDVPEGEHILVMVKRRSIGIYRIDGEFFGLLNRCPHRAGPICEGNIVTFLASDRPGHYERDPSHVFVECPWHGWEFDIRTGQSYFDPERTRVRPYPVEVERGARLVKGPYVAETIPVSVEDDYVVVTMGA